MQRIDEEMNTYEKCIRRDESTKKRNHMERFSSFPMWASVICIFILKNYGAASSFAGISVLCVGVTMLYDWAIDDIKHMIKSTYIAVFWMIVLMVLSY